MKAPTYWLPRAAGDFEVSQSKEVRNPTWVAVRNDLNRAPLVDLISHQDGAAHLGAYLAIVLIASRAKPRWHLVDEIGRPHTAETLERVSRLPKSVFEGVIPRLLEFKQLAIVRGKTPRIRAVVSDQAAADRETNGERSGEPGQRNGRREERTPPPEKRTKQEVRAREALRPGASSTANGAAGRNHFREVGGGEQTWASPADELRALFLDKTGSPMTNEVFDAVTASLERSGIPLSEFGQEARRRFDGNVQNAAGLLRSLAKSFRSKTARTSSPLTAAEAADRHYRCAICGSNVRGEGLLISGRKMFACSCATPEYIAQKRASGLAIEDGKPPGAAEFVQ